MKNSYNCPTCKDTCWIISLDGKATRCKCFEFIQVKEQWEASGLKSEDADKTFTSYVPFNVATRKLKWVASDYFKKYEDIKNTKYNSILLCGAPGAGKTHLCIALANNFIKKGYKVVYLPYVDVMKKLKQNIIDGKYYQHQAEKYKNADILLIDDLFKGKINETDVSIMFEIINHRYINKKTMIISTEFLIDRMLNFDEAIGSRIYEMAKAFTVEVISEDKENNYRLREEQNEI